jgi:DNA-binding transcriptional regulator LsrR (DeoR family)
VPKGAEVGMGRNKSVADLRLLTKVSKLYHDDGLNQDDIVKRLQLSRSKVSRLLQQARDAGIVKIVVIPPAGIHADVEAGLEAKYRIQEAIVTEIHESASPDSVARELGVAAASYLQRVISAEDVVGVSWGFTISGMVAALEPASYPNVQVVQLTGGIGKPESEAHATDLCHRLARLLGCKLVLLPAPGVVDSLRSREVYLLDKHVQQALGLFPQISLAFVGIGSPTSHSIQMRDDSILTQADLSDLLARGAVGDIALRFIDPFGQLVASEMNDRVIGIDLERLRKIPRVVGVAGGPTKVDAIRGALRGGIVDVLITDLDTARSLLT